MNPSVIDSSVAYKWLCQDGEDGLEEAFAVLWAHRNGTVALCAPATLNVELASSLRHSEHTSEEDTVKLIDALGDLGVTLAEATPSQLVKAVRLSYRHRISIYDALFLALAEELGCPLITADRTAFANIDTSVEIRLL